MADDPYTVLGVSRGADAAAIRKAYRALARKHHPDLNPGDLRAEATFKAVSAANDLLSDADKRAAFDRGEIDADGQARPERPRYRDFAEGAAGRRYRPQPDSDASSASGSGSSTASGNTSGNPAGGWGVNEDELGDIFGSIFGQHGGRASGPIRGRDELYGLTVDLLDAVQGATRRLTLPGGQVLDVRIPAGLEDGQTLRLRGKGGSGLSGGEPGDALIQVKITPHPFFRRQGHDIQLELPVTVREAVLGARISIPTPAGTVAMTIKPGSDGGQVLRLRGRGVPAHDGHAAGDLLVTLKIVIGTVDPALEGFLRDWQPAGSIDPREAMLRPGS